MQYVRHRTGILGNLMEGNVGFWSIEHAQLSKHFNFNSKVSVGLKMLQHLTYHYQLLFSINDGIKLRSTRLRMTRKRRGRKMISLQMMFKNFYIKLNLNHEDWTNSSLPKNPGTSIKAMRSHLPHKFTCYQKYDNLKQNRTF